MRDPVSGALTREQLTELVNAPFGEATKAIRKIDPLWGVREGQKIKWKVTFTRETRETGHATVEAETEEEAETLAQNLKDSEIHESSFSDSDPWEIDEIEPSS